MCTVTVWLEPWLSLRSGSCRQGELAEYSPGPPRPRSLGTGHECQSCTRLYFGFVRRPTVVVGVVIVFFYRRPGIYLGLGQFIGFPKRKREERKRRREKKNQEEKK